MDSISDTEIRFRCLACGAVNAMDHGIFIDEADEVLVECKSGEIKRLTRPV